MDAVAPSASSALAIVAATGAPALISSYFGVPVDAIVCATVGSGLGVALASRADPELSSVFMIVVVGLMGIAFGMFFGTFVASLGVPLLAHMIGTPVNEVLARNCASLALGFATRPLMPTAIDALKGRIRSFGDKS